MDLIDYILDMTSPVAEASEYSKAHLNEIMPILWAESANDPEGWIPKLNTYNKMRKPKEELVDTMKRVSSAYRTKSPEYKKAVSGDFIPFEKKVWGNMEKVVSDWQPDENWNYLHHESPSFYNNNENEMVEILKKKWGKDVDYDKRLKIGKEFYFPNLQKGVK